MNISNWLTTSRSRWLVFIAATVFISAVLKLTQGSIWQQRVVGIVIGTVSLILFCKFRTRWKALKFRLMRNAMHVIKAWREFFHLSPIVKALHLLALAFCFLCLALRIGIGENASTPVFWITGLILAIAGICEIKAQASNLLKKAWAPVLGKVLSVSIGVAITMIALSRAKQLVHSLSPIDTKYLTEFTTLTTALYSPILFITAIGIGMALYASCQLLLLIIFILSNDMMIQSRAVLGDTWIDKQRIFWYRMREGKRPPGNTAPPRQFISEFEISMIMSPLSKIALALILVQGVEVSTASLPLMAPWLKKAMVKIEYRPGSACKNIDKNLGVVYMDDGNVSVARHKEDDYIFNVEACEFYEKEK